MSDRKKLVKLEIRSFAKRDFKGEDVSLKFNTPINPESFTLTFKVNAEASSGSGTPGTEAKYKYTEPEQLKLDFILDGTRTLEGYGGDNKDFKEKKVEEQLKKLKDCIYKFDGKIHRPRFLIITWGSEINFKCILTNLDLNYTLFEPDGSPLRVKVSATFLAHQPNEESLAKAKKNSPDLTHARIATEADRLDLLTDSIYNDPKYLMQVAKANRLVTLRQLKPGADLYFPPFNKNEA